MTNEDIQKKLEEFESRLDTLEILMEFVGRLAVAQGAHTLEALPEGQDGLTQLIIILNSIGTRWVENDK